MWIQDTVRPWRGGVRQRRREQKCRLWLGCSMSSLACWTLRSIYINIYIYIFGVYVYIYMLAVFLNSISLLYTYWFPRWVGGKELACKAGDTGVMGLIPRLGRSPGGGNGNPLLYSCLENPTDREAWRAMVPGVTRSRTRLSMHTHFRIHNSTQSAVSLFLPLLFLNSMLDLGLSVLGRTPML